MSDDKTPSTPSTAQPAGPDNTVSDLENEPGIPSVTQPPKVTVTRKRVVEVGLLVVMLIAVIALMLLGGWSGPKKDEDQPSKLTSGRPSAAAADIRKVDMTLPPVVKPPASSVTATEYRIPAILPLPEDAKPEPIPVRRSEPQRMAPEDAPAVLLASRPHAVGGVSAAQTRQNPATGDGSEPAPDPLDNTRRNLDAYQNQLQKLLDTLTKSTDAATGSGSASTLPAMANGLLSPPMPRPTPVAGLFGGQLEASSTPRVTAGVIANRSLTLPKGTAFTCALKTKIVSASSGFVSCQVQRNVFGEDGRVLLIERGSHMDGEYRIASVRPGTVRIPVLWTRIRTPNAVTVDIDSPGTGPLGESGVDGWVDNRWVERIGAALLLSLINDSVKLVIQNQGSDAQGGTVVLPSTTSNSSKLAEKVLDSTINIPPLIYHNQGGIVGIYVARDVDFSSVYELKAVER